MRDRTIPGLDRAIEYGIGLAVLGLMALGLVLIATSVQAGDDYWANQRAQELQIERQQVDQQNQKTMQEWTRPTHPTWNEQQAERAHTPPVSTYNRYDNGPTGTRQQLCMSSHNVTTCY